MCQVTPAGTGMNFPQLPAMLRPDHSYTPPSAVDPASTRHGPVCGQVVVLLVVTASIKAGS